jgi:hypothetical protein
MNEQTRYDAQAVAGTIDGLRAAVEEMHAEILRLRALLIIGGIDPDQGAVKE